ncbi:MAG: ROK family protein [Dongiaceae bacterium]
MAAAGTLAIDIGGSKIAAALVAGDRVAARVQAATPADAAELVAAVAALALPLLPRASGPVGVATTGLVADGTVSSVNPGTLGLPDRLPLGPLLEAALGRPVRLVNDAQAAAWGEHRAGAGIGAAGFAFLTVSTGVGGGVVVDGRLLAGPRGLAGHLGHMVLRPDGPPCGCGRRGCVEALASGRAIAARASAALGRPVAAAEAIAAAASDPRAGAVVAEAVGAIAELCLNLRAALDLDRVALGGSVGLNRRFAARVAAQVAAAPALFRLAVVAAALGPDAGLVGAAALAGQ